MLGSGGGSGRRLWIGKWIIDLGALVALGRFLGGQGGAFLTWRESTGRRLECLWGLVGSCGVLWGFMGGCC